MLNCRNAKNKSTFLEKQGKKGWKRTLCRCEEMRGVGTLTGAALRVTGERRFSLVSEIFSKLGYTNSLREQKYTVYLCSFASYLYIYRLLNLHVPDLVGVYRMWLSYFSKNFRGLKGESDASATFKNVGCLNQYSGVLAYEGTIT